METEEVKWSGPIKDCMTLLHFILTLGNGVDTFRSFSSLDRNALPRMM